MFSKRSFITVALFFLVSTLLTYCKKDEHVSTPNCNADTTYKHLKDSLWAYYPIKGSLADSSGHAHQLNLIGGASLSYDKFGMDNEALNFDGNSGYGIIPDGSKFPSSDFTVSFFLMPRKNYGFFFGKQDYNTANAAAFNVGIDDYYIGDVSRFSVSTNQNTICSEAPAGGDICLGNKAFYTDAWYHLAVTFEKGTMKYFINGNLVNTINAHNTKINSCSGGQFVLASWWMKDPKFFDGKMDELRIYNRALSEKEIQYIFSH